MTEGDAGRQWQIEVGSGEETTAVLAPASGERTGALFVCAHGAGGHMADPGMLALSGVLCARGLDVVRFNFPYREKKSARPDPMPRLTECVAAVAEFAHREVGPRAILLGGRSMGGRAATMLAADGFACDGLMLFAYPLHPAGRPDKLRSAHLERIDVPVLCLNGTRDTLCRQDLMTDAVGRLADRWTMHWLDGADHGFHVLKSSGRSDGGVLDEVGEAVGAWLAGLQRSPGRPAR